MNAVTPAAMAAVLAHIEEQAAEIERLRNALLEIGNKAHDASTGHPNWTPTMHNRLAELSSQL